ncbi:MAG: SAM-dependent methyltransferase [Planctomycetota bacterium]|nr:MAG: SAM-dependent methyltransferase [Planctomycetota bacterium]
MVARRRPERGARPSLTAQCVALLRACERLRPREQRLVDDPWALPLLEASGSALASLGRTRLGARLFAAALDRPPFGLARFVPLRHGWIDERIEAAFARGLRQVVIVGAGLDARAHRLAPRGAGEPRWFELDHPSVSTRKRQAVHALFGGRDPVRRVAIDLRYEPVAPALEAAGFEPAEPAVFVWEGVSYYLPREAIVAALEGFAQLAAPGSELLFDGMYAPRRRSWGERSSLVVGRALLRRVGEPLLGLWERQGAFTPEARLRAAGFPSTEVLAPPAFAERLRRAGRRPASGAPWFLARAARIER